MGCLLSPFAAGQQLQADKFAKDASGHEHAADGKFGKGDGDSGKSADDHASHLEAKAEKLSAEKKTFVNKAVGFIQKKYAALEKDFGRKGAITIMAASVILMAAPVPGSSLAPLAIAKAYKAIKTKRAGSMSEEFAEGDDDTDGLIAAVRAVVQEAAEQCGEDAPELSDDDIRKAIVQHNGGDVAKHSESDEPTTEPEGQAPDQVALPGRDGDKAEALLAHSKSAGIRTLADVTRSALERLVKLKPAKLARTTELFNKQERQQFTEMLAAVNSTANLMGRARVRIRQQRAEQLRGIGKFSEEPTNFDRFDEAGPLKPMPPEDALAYFRRLVPRIGVDPHQFSTDANREAFTMAQATEETLLKKCQDLIAEYLEKGKVENAAKAKQYPAEHLDEMLHDAGVHPSNPQYSDMVIRTNMKDAYNVGADMERQDPDVAETFPVWQYVGILDGREGSDHRPKFGRYYPNSASFTEVRGKRPYNCRCDQIPIDKWEWAEKLARGARVETSW